MGFPLPPRLASIITSIAVIATTAAVAASDTEATWLYPDPNTTPTFNYLDTLNASWTSDFSTPWLHLWCGVTNANSSSPVLGEPYNKTAPATGSLEFPLNYALEPFSCHFELSREPAVGQGPPFALSGTFNVAIQSDAKPVTWSQNTGNSSTASTGTNASKDPESTASPTPSSAPAAATSTPAKPQTSSASGLSSGAKAGIGIGVALGSLALIAAAYFCFIFWRRHNARKKASPTAYASELDAPDTTGATKGFYGPDGKYVSRLEMPVEEKVHEKDSASVGMGTGAAWQPMGELEAPR